MALNGSQVFLYFVQQLCQSELLEHSVCTIGMSFFCQFVTYASVSSQLQCRLCLQYTEYFVFVVFAKLEELKLERRKFITVYSCASVQQRQSRSTLSASRGHLSARAELYSETEQSSLE